MTLAALVDRLAGHRILVAGDLVLDEYLTGRPARVSREAPVLILDELERDYRAGSACNPAANIRALGSEATIVGAIGTDIEGDRLKRSLEGQGVRCDGLVQVDGGTTARKTRILAEGFTGGLHGRQQVLRVDLVPPLAADVAAACAARIGSLAPLHQAVLLSDYLGGVVEGAAIEAARRSGRPIAVDSQGDLGRFRGVDVIKVNQAEAQRALGSRDVLSGGERLRRDLGVGALVVTLGADGLVLFADAGTIRVPALHASAVFDVTGAGDTVIAVLTLALVAGVPLADGVRLANAAASLVVRKLGVATVSPGELRATLT